MESNEILWNILKEHRGHKVSIASYGDWDNPANICLECEDCGEVILDAELYTICAREDDSGTDSGIKNAVSNEHVTYTVAECSEYHSIGMYYDNIGSVEEAAKIYKKMDASPIHGIPAIGIRIHKDGDDELDDDQMDIVVGKRIDTESLVYYPRLYKNKIVQEAINEMKKIFPDYKVM